MRSSAHRLVRWALAIPVAFHGSWNLTAEGARWWESESGLPKDLRFLVGLAEIAGACSLAGDFFARWAAGGLVLIFLGALPQHWRNGFSFKNGGWEPLFVYALLALSIVVPDRKNSGKERGVS